MHILKPFIGFCNGFTVINTLQARMALCSIQDLQEVSTDLPCAANKLAEMHTRTIVNKVKNCRVFRVPWRALYWIRVIREDYHARVIVNRLMQVLVDTVTSSGCSL